MLTTEKTVEEKVKDLETLLVAAQKALLKYPFQTTIRQNISILKDRKRLLLKEIQITP